MLTRISTKFTNIFESKLKNAELACTNPKYAFQYAKNNNLKKFELGESVIATNTYTSYWYAYYILNRKFELGEPMIATNAYTSCMYAIKCIKQRFYLGENSIRSNDLFKRKYEEFFLISL